MPIFLLAPLGFYVLAMAVGLLLRLGSVLPIHLPSYANALHAHSHTLFFGWGALGIFALVFRRLGEEGRRVRALLASIAGLSAASFVSFLHGGYSLPSIVLSTLSLGIWAWAIATAWRSMRGKRALDIAFLRAGLVYLGIACIGAIVRVVLIATAASAHQKSLAVYAFLHAFGWFFVFSVTGLLVHEARVRRLHVDERRFRRMLDLALPTAWLAFPLGVVGGSQGALGVLARLSALWLAFPMASGVVALWRISSSAEPALRGAFRWLAFWLGIAALSSLAGGLGFAELAVRSRHLAILHLHVLLAGYVSFGLMTALFSTLGARLGVGSLLHNLGLAIMSLGLALAALPVLGWSRSPGVAFAGAVLAALGGALVFAAGVGFCVRLWRQSKRLGRLEPPRRDERQASPRIVLEIGNS